MPSLPCLDDYLAQVVRHLAAAGTPQAQDPIRLEALDALWATLDPNQRHEACDLVERARGQFRIQVRTMHTSAGPQHLVNIEHPSRPLDASLFEPAGVMTPYESDNLEHAQLEAQAWREFLNPAPTWEQMLAGRHLDPALHGQPGHAPAPVSQRDPAPIGQAVLDALAQRQAPGTPPDEFIGLLQRCLAARPHPVSPAQAGQDFLATLRVPHRQWEYTPSWKFVSQVARQASGLPARKTPGPA